MKNIPKHIAFIADGNRRWAKKRGLSTFQGHRRGFELIKKVITWCLERNIRILTFYVFSTENWKRSSEEVDYLLNKLFTVDLFQKHIKEINKQGIRVLVSGRRQGLPKPLRQRIRKAEDLTKKNTNGIVVFALNYGGRVEIVDALKHIIKKEIPAKKVDEELIKENLYVSGVPYPDLMIRTSGEKRLSNFLLWQSAYSELCFIKKHWPDFTEEDLEKALRKYSKRQRRFGK